MILQGLLWAWGLTALYVAVVALRGYRRQAIASHRPLRLQRARMRRHAGGLMLVLAAVALVAAPMVLQVVR